jgi:heme/copper-type cytochrome/quinol oxidase subunit 3
MSDHEEFEKVHQHLHDMEEKIMSTLSSAIAADVAGFAALQAAFVTMQAALGTQQAQLEEILASVEANNGVATAQNMTDLANLRASMAATQAAVSGLKLMPTIIVIPASGFTVPVGTQLQFNSSAPSNWSTSAGTIDATGMLTAPVVAGPIVVAATALDGTGATSTSTGAAV